MKESFDLRQYVAEQITDYVTTQTTGNRVSPQQMKTLENGVKNICYTAYPEHEAILSKQVARIVRAALEMKQLGLSEKMKRIIDSTRAPKDDVISGMLNDIICAKSTMHPTPIVHPSWVNKLQAEKSRLLDVSNTR